MALTDEQINEAAKTTIPDPSINRYPFSQMIERQRENWIEGVKSETARIHHQQEWIPVTNSLPKPEPNDNRITQHIPCVVYGPKIGIMFSPYNPHHNCWDDEDGDDYFTDAIGGKVSHWQPLPPAPTINQNK